MLALAQADCRVVVQGALGRTRFTRPVASTLIPCGPQRGTVCFPLKGQVGVRKTRVALVPLVPVVPLVHVAGPKSHISLSSPSSRRRP